MNRFLLLFSQSRLWFLLLLGFASGLPLALVGSTLQAWFAVSGIDIVSISSLSLIGMPYLYKFLWAPLLDRYTPPLLGRRRGWICLAQVGLIGGFVIMACLNPRLSPWTLATAALFVALCSATQDIAIDAYRADILSSEERGLGVAMAIGGYRLAMLVSGGLALFMADEWGWPNTYGAMAIIMCLVLVISMRAPATPAVSIPAVPLRRSLIEPWKELWQRPQIITILLFILSYKVSEAFTSTSGTLTNTFLLTELQFSLSTVGLVNKGIGIIATVLGVFIGGFCLVRMTLYRALWRFGILQAISNLGYCFLALQGKSFALLIMAVFIDNLSAGLGMAALLAYMMSLCNQRYSAAQFALLSAVAMVGRVLLSPLAGLIVASSGWVWFYFMTFLFALPCLGLLYAMRSGFTRDGALVNAVH